MSLQQLTTWDGWYDIAPDRPAPRAGSDTEACALLRRLAARPRLLAWAGLSALLIALILITSLGRDLAPLQYLGLIAVAIVTSALAVAFVYDDGADTREQT